jgi:hypothetical protein
LTTIRPGTVARMTGGAEGTVGFLVIAEVACVPRE